MTRHEDRGPNAAMKGERLRVFVSSVQKEMEDERLVVQQLLSTDSFLAAH